MVGMKDSTRSVIRFADCLACAAALRRSGDVATMVFHCHWCRRHFQPQGWAGMQRLRPNPVVGQTGLVYVCEECEGAQAMGFRSMVDLEDRVGARSGIVRNRRVKRGAA